jgi:cytochrome c-type biogenesis protein CcsB
MKKILNILFSMPTMGFLILLFASAIGVATFIENDFGTTAAKAVVFNSNWFNILLLILAINLVANIIRTKMWAKRKLTMFIYHISFIVVLLGSGITRYISYEGTMHIREGKASSSILSDQTFIDIKINDNGNKAEDSKSILISNLNQETFGNNLEINGKNFKFNSVKFIPNATETITETMGNGDPYIVLVSSFNEGGRRNHSIKYNTQKQIGPFLLNFGNSFTEGAINIKLLNDTLLINPPTNIITTSMGGGPNDTLRSGEWSYFESRYLYNANGLNMVLTNFYKKGKTKLVTYSGKDVKLMDAIMIEVVSGDETKIIAVRGGKGYKGEESLFSINDANVSITYGSKDIELPFSLKLIDFQLDRYPGSNSPSSYSSDVILIDKEQGIEQAKKIYMNNVLNHRGYRFFQSSYDSDEKGTVLSVNHDYWGTLFTYLGYFLMALGMVLSLVNNSSRFAKLGNFLKKTTPKQNIITSIIITVFVLMGSQSMAGNTFNEKDIPVINKDHAEQFGKLMVQSQEGRLKPVNTLSSELIRKITGGKSSLYGMNSDQVFLGMMSNPLFWQSAPIIKVKHDKVKDLIGIDGKYASYLDFIDLESSTYKLSKQVNKAYETKPANRGTYEKELISVDERLNITYMIFTNNFLQLLPDPNDHLKAWYSPQSHLHGLDVEDSAFISSVIPSYLSSVNENNMTLANQLLKGIGDYQNKYGSKIMPSKSKIMLEIRYNKMNIFNRLGSIYGLLGLIIIIFSFIAVFKQSKIVNVILKVLTIIVVFGFILQTAGLGLRWYISGHAPWSNGYESMIYIAWVTMLAGLLFARKSNMTIGATTILTSIILMVAHLSWMNPEITNLVPVLKSYWLTIHVSVITGSYGFLALSMLLGFLNMLLMIFRNSENSIKMNSNIKELSAISERSMTVGLFMLTIGTFLGGIWANESWGRYWGWDPKETWALVSILVYSFILHMRYIPGLKGKYSFNFTSVIGFFSILMTYFGVNYYLSGLHSYASGDPMPIPSFLYYTIAVIALVSILAFVNERKYSDKKIEETV